jgi:hypothetical protein
MLLEKDVLLVVVFVLVDLRLAGSGTFWWAALNERKSTKVGTAQFMENRSWLLSKTGMFTVGQ